MMKKDIKELVGRGKLRRKFINELSVYHGEIKNLKKISRLQYRPRQSTNRQLMLNRNTMIAHLGQTLGILDS